MYQCQRRIARDMEAYPSRRYCHILGGTTVCSNEWPRLPSAREGASLCMESAETWSSSRPGRKPAPPTCTSPPSSSAFATTFLQFKHSPLKRKPSPLILESKNLLEENGGMPLHSHFNFLPFPPVRAGCRASMGRVSGRRQGIEIKIFPSFPGPHWEGGGHQRLGMQHTERAAFNATRYHRGFGCDFKNCALEDKAGQKAHSRIMYA
jgi:hypothetical protein